MCLLTIDLSHLNHEKKNPRQIHLFVASSRKLLLSWSRQNDYKCSYILFLIKYKTRNIMKTEQTTIVHAQWDRWTLCDGIEHHMITSDVILK